MYTTNCTDINQYCTSCDNYIVTVTIKMAYTDAEVQLPIDNTASQVGFNSLFLSRETPSPDLYLGML